MDIFRYVNPLCKNARWKMSFEDKFYISLLIEFAEA
jgi:hypothetical protein